MIKQEHHNWSVLFHWDFVFGTWDLELALRLRFDKNISCVFINNDPDIRLVYSLGDGLVEISVVV